MYENRLLQQTLSPHMKLSSESRTPKKSTNCVDSVAHNALLHMTVISLNYLMLKSTALDLLVLKLVSKHGINTNIIHCMLNTLKV